MNYYKPVFTPFVAIENITYLLSILGLLNFLSDQLFFYHHF